MSVLDEYFPNKNKCPICNEYKQQPSQTCRACYMKYRHVRTNEERFWEKVDIRGNNECWNWKGCKQSKYGSFIYNRKQCPAHRVSWILNYGEIPEGKIICHHCDNYICVNPNHLFIGTHQDNYDDMRNKNRQNHLGNAKLNPEIVKEIRNYYRRTKISTVTLGEIFNISKAQAWRVVAKRCWTDV